MLPGRVLVAGATGQLGGVITRRLLEAGVPVRAVGRNREKLAALERAGAEALAADLLDVAALSRACRDVDQIVSTANNFLGTGPTSPGRVDLTAHQNLCAAARNARVRRLVFISFRGANAGEPNDFFRLKWYIEDAIRRSGVPYVILRPSAFMEIWIDQILADSIRKKGGAVIFGDGSRVANYISIEDVAAFVVRVLGAVETVNQMIDIGGPSNLSLNDLAGLVERKLGASGKRRHVPIAALKWLPLVVRPFNDVTARLMSVGYYAASRATPFPNWREAADRFGVSPRSVEAYLDAWPGTASR